MQTTLHQLAEQILYIYKGQGHDDRKITMQEIKLLVRKVTHEIFALEKPATSGMPYTDFVSQHLIATYRDVAVVHDENACETYSELPLYPMRVPLDMGVWEITEPKDRDNPFIPLPNAARGIISSLPVGNLEQQIGYEVEGRRVYYNKDITEPSNGEITAVKIKMLVVDIDTLDDNDPYPIPPEYEGNVVREVLKILGVREQNTDNVNDSQDN